MAHARQFGFGLDLLSDLRVPGAVAAPPGNGAAPVRITLTDPGETGREAGFAREGDTVVYRNPVGDFRCRADSIAITPADPPDHEDLGALLVANALPAVLWLRGGFVLHAAAVRLPDGLCLGIAGHSGSGKSRLAASLVESGAALIGDDSLALHEEAGAVIASGLPGGWFARSGEGGARTFRVVPPAAALGSAWLDALVVLGEHGPAGSRPTTLEALELLLQHRHRPQVPLLLGQQAQGLAAAARMARALPLVRLGPATGSDAALASLQTALVRLARQAVYDRGQA